MLIRLDQLKVGEEGKITEVNAASRIKRRLLGLGLVPGEKVKLERIAPLGDPIEIFVKGFHLSLRKEEASGVMVEVE
jgi:Fe2+ transport system protein FeoA